MSDSGKLLYVNPEVVKLNAQWNWADKLISRLTIPAALITGLASIAVNLPRIASFLGYQPPVQFTPDLANMLCFTPIIPAIFAVATRALIDYGTSAGKRLNKRDILGAKLIQKELEKPIDASKN